jgi:hypothetical protein
MHNSEIQRLMHENATMRGLLLWALYHHQGGSSAVGQPIRKALGIGEFDHLTTEQIAEAKKCGCSAHGNTHYTENSVITAHNELLKIHAILMAPGDCPDSTDDDTLTVRLLKALIHDWHTATRERDHYKEMDALHIQSLGMTSAQLAEAKTPNMEFSGGAPLHGAASAGTQG